MQIQIIINSAWALVHVPSSSGQATLHSPKFYPCNHVWTLASPSLSKLQTLSSILAPYPAKTIMIWSFINVSQSCDESINQFLLRYCHLLSLFQLEDYYTFLILVSICSDWCYGKLFKSLITVINNLPGAPLLFLQELFTNNFCFWTPAITTPALLYIYYFQVFIYL